MLWGSAERWQMYLGTTICGLAPATSAPRWQASTEPEQWLAGLDADLRRNRRLLFRRRPSLRVWLSGALARPFLLAPMAGLRNRSEILQVARRKAAEGLDLNLPTDLWLDSTDLKHPAIGVVMPKSMRSALDAFAIRNGFVLRSIAPWWAGALDTVLSNSQENRLDLFAVRDDDSLTVLGSSEEQWRLAETLAPPPAPSQSQATLLRMALSGSGHPLSLAHVRIDTAAVDRQFWPSFRALDAQGLS